MLKIDNLREFTDFNFTICDKAHGSFLITFFSAGEEENSACVLMYCSHLCTEKNIPENKCTPTQPEVLIDPKKKPTTHNLTLHVDPYEYHNKTAARC